MNLGFAFYEGVTLGTQVLCCMSASKLCGIGTPKSAAVFETGRVVSYRIMNFALDSIVKPHFSSTMKDAAAFWLMFGISYQVGKLLSKKICAVDITAKDALKLYVGMLPSLCAIGLGMKVGSFIEGFVQAYARNHVGNL